MRWPNRKSRAKLAGVPAPSPTKVCQVWTLDPDELKAADLAFGRRLLSADEIQRADRFHFERDRRIFAAAHALLRLALSREAPEVAPDEWRFATGLHGRPEIVGSGRGLRFNLSHTRGLVGCLVAREIDCGIDIEDAARTTAVEGLEGLVLAERERGSMESLEPAERQDRLLRYWTLKEAYAKARGLGLSLPIKQVTFQLDDAAPRLEDDPTWPHSPRQWRFRQWRPTSRHWLAVALRTEAPELEIELFRPGGLLPRNFGS